jgi:putative transcriptional regulator
VIKVLYFRINELLKKNKKSKYWFIKNMEGGYQSLSRLMDNKTKAIHFDTVEKMCDLFNCEIGELIEIKKTTKKKRKDDKKK